MGSKGPEVPKETTRRTTDLPEYADPYFRRLLQGAEESTMPFDPGTGESRYQPYESDRLTEASDYQDILSGRELVRGVAGQGIPGLSDAQEAFQRGIDSYEGMVGGLQDARMFDSAAAQQYMSPYMQNVVDIQKRQARQDFQEAQAGRDAQAIQADAFGGSRQAVVQGKAEEDLDQRLRDIQAIGQQQAFESAQRQFGADRTAEMQRQMQQAEFDAAMTGRGLSTAKGLVGLGELERGADIADARLLEGIGAAQRAEDQAKLDMAYQDFLRQRDFPISQYERFAGVLRGVPVSANITDTAYARVNPIQQALGAGLSAYGLYRGFGGGAPQSGGVA